MWQKFVVALSVTGALVLIWSFWWSEGTPLLAEAPKRPQPTTRPVASRRMLLLFTQDGKELSDPTYELTRQLSLATPRECARLCDELAEIMSGGGGYSRYVALRAVWQLIGAGMEDKKVSRAAVKAWAENAIQIAPLPRHGLSGGRYVVTGEALRKHRAGDGYVFFIHPRCAVEVDSQTLVLSSTLPRGWSARDVAVEVDGRALIDKPGEYGVKPGDSARFPMEVIDLNDVWPTDEQLYGSHVITSKMTIVAQDGTAVPLKRVMNVEVVRETRH